MEWAKRVLGFALVPALGVAAPLLAYPLIVETSGMAGFGAIVLGQAVGAGFAVLIELGWSLFGPQLVAGVQSDMRFVLLRRSLSMKSRVFVVVAPAAGLIAGLLANEYQFAVVVASLSTCATGLSSAWFFVGLGSVRNLMLFDSLPRLLSVLAGTGLLFQSGVLWVFPLCQLLGLVCATLLTLVAVRIPSGGEGVVLREESTLVEIPGIPTWRGQGEIAISRLASAAYINLPVVFLQLVAPNSVPVFAAYDRMLRLGLLAVQAVPNALQGYLGELTGDDAALSDRRTRAFAAQFSLGVISALMFVFGMPLALSVVFQGKVSQSLALGLFGGAVAFLTCVTRSLAMLHVSYGAYDWVVRSAWMACGTFLVVVVPLASTFGASGGFLALLAAEAVATLVQLGGLKRVSQRR